MKLSTEAVWPLDGPQLGGDQGSQSFPPPPALTPSGPCQAGLQHDTGGNRGAFPFIDKRAGSDQRGLSPPFLISGAKERAQQQKKHSSFEEELSEVREQQNDQGGLKGACWPAWRGTRAEREEILTVVVIDRGLLGGKAPPPHPVM